MKVFVSLFLTFLCFPLWADFEFFRGVRQMGMGGASIAVVNDETAVLSNPNGLGKLRDYFYTPIDPELTGGLNSSEELLETSVFGMVNPDDTYQALAGQIGEPIYFKGQVFPSIVLPNFGIGVLGRYEVLARRNADGTYDYNYQNDYSLNLAYNMRFWGGRIKLGFAGRLINRVEFFGTRDPNTESLAISAFAREGMGIAVDAGLTLAAPITYLPTLTIYVRDVGNTSFTAGAGAFGNGDNGDPQGVNQSIDVAVALFPIYSNHSRGALTVEYEGLLDEEVPDQEVETMDRLHVGTEFNLWDAYFFRAGYHQNDWTAGFEYSTSVFQWQFATYGEKITFGGVTTRDRRGVLKLAVRF